MLNLPVLRWGQPYTSIDVDPVVHFATGEPVANVSRANGGLIQREVRDTATNKIPILGELPFIGAAFSNKSFTEEEKELVILVTPHLVDPMDCKQVPHHLPGLETRNPDDFELFLEGILEAPRGPREVCPGGQYTPAFKNDPTAGLFPCAGGKGGCGSQPSVLGDYEPVIRSVSQPYRPGG